MTVLAALERLLGDAAENLAPAGERVAEDRVERPRRRWQRRPSLGLLVVLVLAGASTALAAGVFQTGAPITTPAGYAPQANVGWGAPVPGSFRLLSLRVADPAGGPPWGLGVFRTTEGLACPVAGRIVNGRLGALGIGYTFADDGRFHPLLPAAAIFDNCAPPDARGHLYLQGAGWLGSVSGEAGLGDVAFRQQPQCRYPGDPSREIRCPASALRTVFYGFLGPQARSVSYTYKGVHHVEAVSGPDGGYLIVLPAPSAVTSKAANNGEVGPSVAPSMTYRSGVTCPLRSTVFAVPGPCRTVGYRSGPLDPPARAGLTTHTRMVYNKASLLVSGPTLAVRFKAPRAITNARYTYAFRLQRPETAACRSAARRDGVGMRLSATTRGSIRAGQNVTITLPLVPPCTGRYIGTLVYHRALRWLGFGEIYMNRLSANRPASIPMATIAHTLR